MMIHLNIRPIMVAYLLTYSSFGCNQQSQMSRSQPEIRSGRRTPPADIKIRTTTPRPDVSPVVPPKKPKPGDSGPRCQLRISELNADNVGQNFKQYLELSMKCETRSGPTPKNPLVGHRLMIFKANPLQLVFVYNFDNPEFQISDKKEFVVIGSPGVEHLDVNLKSRHVQNIYTNSFNINLLPAGVDDEFAVVLAYSPSKTALQTFKLIEASNFYPKRFNLDAELVPLHDSITDFLIYGNPRSLPESNLARLLPESIAKDQRLTIRNWNSRKAKDTDFSINRCCTHSTAFTPSCYSLGALTAGRPNDCSKHPQQPAEPQIACLPGSANINPNLHRVKDPYIKLPMEQVLQWKARTFNSGAMETCRAHLPKQDSTYLEQSSIQKWLDIVATEGMCTLRCFPCYSYLSLGFRRDLKHRFNLQGEGGFTSGDIYENSRQLKAHETNKVHEEAFEFLSKILPADNQEQVDSVVKEYEDNEVKRYEATSNMVRFVYAEILTGNSFSSHTVLLDAAKLAGAKLGRIHFTSVAAQQITAAISTWFEKQFLEYLVRTKPLFSIIVDTTSNHNEPLLIVYIQTLEGSYPIVQFFCLIHLEEGEKGAAMVRALMAAVRERDILVPGFAEYFAQYLVSIASDSASSMVGIRNSFHSHLQDEIGRKIPIVKCLAHKADLALRKGLKADPLEVKKLDKAATSYKFQLATLQYFQNFEKGCNELFRFYAGRTHKRWQHLKELSLQIGFKPTRLKYFFEIRWSAAHHLAMTAVKNNYEAMLLDLLEISGDEEFLDDVKLEAFLLYQQLSDKFFAAVVREFLDFLLIFKVISKEFQESAGLLPGKATHVFKAINSLEVLKHNPGETLLDFLAQISCHRCTKGTCTLIDYEACGDVKFGRTTLHDESPKLKLSVMRIKLYDSLIKGIKHYFDLKVLEAFDIFLPQLIRFDCESTPSNIPRTAEEIFRNTYIENSEIAINTNFLATGTTGKVSMICSFYLKSTEECQMLTDEWALVMEAVSQNGFLENLNEINPAKFWPTALQQTILPWTERTKEFVNNLLVTPTGSSDAERGFSFVTALRRNERTNLHVTTMEQIIRVKINGPEDISDLDAISITLEFLKTHVRSDDEIWEGGRNPTTDTEKVFFKKSRLYSNI